MSGRRIVLHLVRAAAPPDRRSDVVPGVVPGVVAERDWVVYLPAMELAAHGEPPLPPGLIDHDQLVVLTFAADLVITW